jgi:hypothetical protein
VVATLPILTNSSIRTKAGGFPSIGKCFGRRIKQSQLEGNKVFLGLVFLLRLLDKTDGFLLQHIIRYLDD